MQTCSQHCAHEMLLNERRCSWKEFNGVKGRKRGKNKNKLKRDIVMILYFVNLYWRLNREILIPIIWNSSAMRLKR